MADIKQLITPDGQVYYLKDSNAVQKTGDTMSGNLETSADIKFTAKSKGLYGIDTDNNSYPLIRDNGTNMWIGATQTAAKHHVGGVYISAGYDKTNQKGYSTIHISVPNATNTGATNYNVWHSGNLTRLSQLTNDGDGTNNFVTFGDLATDQLYGLVKLNPNESIGVNANGQLTVGGRLGQYPNGGIFYSTDRQPRNVAENTFLITDALGIEMNANRSFAIASGVGLQVKGKHNAGVTEYHIANNYNNRIRCAACQYLSLDEATSKVEMIIPVVSCTIDGQAFTPDSSPDDSTKDIIIVTESSVNPNNALNSGASIRAFGAMNGYASAFIGSCVGAGTGGANFILGQGVYSKTGNMNVVLGQYHYNQGNGNTLLGRWHVSMKNRWLLAGTGHDNTNGIAEAGTAVGAFSDLKSDTLFAVGNGTSATARNNAFEVTSNGGIIVPSSTSGSTKKFKITVDDTGAVSASEVVAA